MFFRGGTPRTAEMFFIAQAYEDPAGTDFPGRVYLYEAVLDHFGMLFYLLRQTIDNVQRFFGIRFKHELPEYVRLGLNGSFDDSAQAFTIFKKIAASKYQNAAVCISFTDGMHDSWYLMDYFFLK